MCGCGKREINPRKHTKMCEACYKRLYRRIKDPQVGLRLHAKPVIKHNLVGTVFGNLTVLSVNEKGSKNPVKLLTYKCLCSCGKKTIIPAVSLVSGNTKSCGCLVKTMNRLRPYEATYRRACRQIKRLSNREMELSYDDFLKLTEQKCCHYCGAGIKWVEYPTKDQNTPYNLDRKDNEKGYSVDNVVVCCKLCNFTKANRFTYDEFLLIASSLHLVQYLRNPLPKEELDFMHTYSGKLFRYLSPDPEDIDIIDIAHSLSQLNRFVGQTLKPYSVAQHSVLVSQICPPEYALYGLLHDASEAYANDICRVLKLSPGMGIYKWYEKRIMDTVCKKFGLPKEEPNEVRKADNILLLTEKRDLFVRDCRWAVNKSDETIGLTPLSFKVEPWEAEAAERKFLEQYSLIK
jgi:hypothetical protein